MNVLNIKFPLLPLNFSMPLNLLNYLHKLISLQPPPHHVTLDPRLSSLLLVHLLLALPSGWAGFYTCPAQRPYQFGPMRVPKSNHRLQVTAIKP